MMKTTVEIRYETLLDMVQQMPPNQLERLAADVRQMLELRRTVKYRSEIVDAARRLEAGNGEAMSLEHLKALIAPEP